MFIATKKRYRCFLLWSNVILCSAVLPTTNAAQNKDTEDITNAIQELSLEPSASASAEKPHPRLLNDFVPKSATAPVSAPTKRERKPKEVAAEKITLPPPTPKETKITRTPAFVLPSPGTDDAPLSKKERRLARKTTPETTNAPTAEELAELAKRTREKQLADEKFLAALLKPPADVAAKELQKAEQKAKELKKKLLAEELERKKASKPIKPPLDPFAEEKKAAKERAKKAEKAQRELEQVALQEKKRLARTQKMAEQAAKEAKEQEEKKLQKEKEQERKLTELDKVCELYTSKIMIYQTELNKQFNQIFAAPILNTKQEPVKDRLEEMQKVINGSLVKTLSLEKNLTKPNIDWDQTIKGIGAYSFPLIALTPDLYTKCPSLQNLKLKEGHSLVADYLNKIAETQGYTFDSASHTYTKK